MFVVRTTPPRTKQLTGWLLEGQGQFECYGIGTGQIILLILPPKSGDPNFNFCARLFFWVDALFQYPRALVTKALVFSKIYRDNRIFLNVLFSRTQRTVLRNTLNCRSTNNIVRGSMQRTGTTKANQPISQFNCTHRASQNCNCATTSGELMNAHLSSSLCLPIAELSSCSECKPSSSLPITNTRVSLSAPNAGSQPSNVP